MLDAVLAAELEADGRTVDPRVLVAHGGQAERLVVPRVLLVADANQRLLGPRASRPVPCRWPRGSVQIQTSVQAGGITSDRIRSRSAGFEIVRPFGSTYRNRLWRPMRRIPGVRTSLTYRSPATRAESCGASTTFVRRTSERSRSVCLRLHTSAR